jgi:hypothetical protein
MRNRGFQFQKRHQLLIATHNERLSVAVMGVNNPRLFARERLTLRPSLSSNLLYEDCLR